MANNSEFQKLMRRARWDRLFGALIVLVLLIILLTCIFKSCGKDTEETGGDVSTITPVETVPPTEPVKTDNSMAVFLSPSTQEDNVYACNDTSQSVCLSLSLHFNKFSYVILGIFST